MPTASSAAARPTTSAITERSMRSWAWNTATTEVESSPSTNGTAAIRIAPRTCGV